ncbi:MAG TPA: hypothetical protein ENI51_03390 [Candidatus Atribacteria bacterium]|nr:hypothetical protein [Candidatus Atribacteria bacterium]
MLFLVDIPHNNILDNESWEERRGIAREWYEIFRQMSIERDFSVDFITYNATGCHNAPLPQELIDKASNYNLILSITEFSATSSLVPICYREDSITRCASMPLLEKQMEYTSLSGDYIKIKKYAIAIREILSNSIYAEILFTNGDNLFVDLRNRVAKADTGECKYPKQFINLPSGEGFIAPYEAVYNEVDRFGRSKTEGVIPISCNQDLGDIIRCVVKENRIVEIIGEDRKTYELQKFFDENITRRNIAELGIGCNPWAVVTGNLIEDEKTGLHIAYGTSIHIGGKVISDVHQDIVFAKGCPIEVEKLDLTLKDGKHLDLILDGEVCYELLD